MTGRATDGTRRSRDRRLRLAAAAVGAAAVVALRFLAGGEIESPVLLLLTIPIGVVALEVGTLAGMTAALAGLATFAWWVYVDGVDAPVAAYLIRALPFAFTALILGRLGETTRAVRAAAARTADEDQMTGLFGRSRFEGEIERHLALRERYGGAGAVFAIDLDHFKYLNDTLGHAAGDQAIRSVAGILRDRLRTTDVAARLGGDEFAVLLPESDRDVAHAVATDVAAAIAAASVVSTSGRRVHLSASIGVATLQGGDCVEAVMSRADAAMYDAKQEGRSGVAVADGRHPSQALSAHRVEWAEHVRRALDEDRFTLFAQPVVDLSDGTTAHAELLLRMRTDDGRMAAPAEFLPAAEQFRMMRAIDRWVVREAIALVGSLPDSCALRLEVNLSASSLNDEELVDVIADDLERHGADASRLVFELTETAALANLERAAAFIGRVKALGASFALDDFGSGFGSYLYLRHLDFDFLKVDAEFVRLLAHDEADRMVVKSIAETARRLGKVTIAEGVEDAESLELLGAWGIDMAQGFHVARPVEATGFLAAAAVAA